MARVAQIPFGAQEGPQPTRQQIQRLQLAQQLMQQGSSSAPVQTPMEGLGRASQAWAGALMDKRQQTQMDERRNAYGADMAEILRGASAKPWINPDTGQPMGQAGGIAGALATAPNLQTPEARTSLAQMQLAQALQGPPKRQFQNVAGVGLVEIPQQGDPRVAIEQPTDLNKAVIMGPDGQPMPNPAYVDAQSQIRRAGKPDPTRVDVNVDTSEDAFAKAFGKKNAEAFFERQEAARDAAQSLRASHEARQLLDSGVITGFGANFKVGLGKALQTAGINLAGDAIANTEAFVGQRAQEVGRIIKMFGAGTGLSDADRAFATKAAAGDIELTDQSIRRLLDINDRATKNVITLYNKDAEKIDPRLSPYPLTVEMPVFEDDKPEPQDTSIRTPPGLSPGVKFLGFE